MQRICWQKWKSDFDSVPRLPRCVFERKQTLKWKVIVITLSNVKLCITRLSPTISWKCHQCRSSPLWLDTMYELIQLVHSRTILTICKIAYMHICNFATCMNIWKLNWITMCLEINFGSMKRCRFFQSVCHCDLWTIVILRQCYFLCTGCDWEFCKIAILICSKLLLWFAQYYYHYLCTIIIVICATLWLRFVQHCGCYLCNIVIVICATLWLWFVQYCICYLCNIMVVICATLWSWFVQHCGCYLCPDCWLCIVRKPVVLGPLWGSASAIVSHIDPSNPPQPYANTPFLPEMFRKYSTSILDLKRKSYFPEASATTMQELKKGFGRL